MISFLDDLEKSERIGNLVYTLARELFPGPKPLGRDSYSDGVSASSSTIGTVQSDNGTAVPSEANDCISTPDALVFDPHPQFPFPFSPLETARVILRVRKILTADDRYTPASVPEKLSGWVTIDKGPSVCTTSSPRQELHSRALLMDYARSSSAKSKRGTWENVDRDQTWP